MERIQLLDDSLINKIAAGEVVERPCSVVKELVENAIDAGATKITVDIQDGGKKRILISDNGCGMSPSDAKKSLLRHATSKIKTAEDLFNLNTMGFRGEALASISAVCRFTLMTCEQGQNEGVKIQMNGDSDIVSSPWQSSGGTTIICDELFFNVPVRKKFLKASGTEYAAILELLQALALSNTNIEFTLIHNGKETLRASAQGGFHRDSREAVLRKRFSQVMKGDAGLDMIYIEGESQWGRVAALISAPGVERASSKDMFLFVNGRWVKDKSLRFAVLRGYHSHLLRGRYPVAAVFLSVDPSLVDANVHPAKTEVRLQYASEIHNMIAHAVRSGIRKGEWAARPSHAIFLKADLTSAVDGEENSISSNHDSLAFSSHRSDHPDQPLRHSAAVWRDVTPSFAQMGSGSGRSPDVGADWTLDHSRFDRLSPDQDQAESNQIVPWRELRYFGSVADCYLLFGHGERASGARLLVVDQHAFHERIIYERLVRDGTLLKSSQTLLVPECVHLGPKATSTIKEMLPVLSNNGFVLDVLDDSNIEVRAVPVLLAKSDVAMLLETIASQSDKLPMDDNIGLLHDHLATFACHAAVRAGESIGHDELKVLLTEADSVDFYHNCPHGRRVLRWWEESQIGRWFDR